MLNRFDKVSISIQYVNLNFSLYRKAGLATVADDQCVVRLD